MLKIHKHTHARKHTHTNTRKHTHMQTLTLILTHTYTDIPTCKRSFQTYYLSRDGTLTNASILQPIEKQIELDLLRTLPNNKLFSNINSDMIQKLRRVLRAYARHNISVGYCQVGETVSVKDKLVFFVDLLNF